MEKTARELLEEATTMIAMPLVQIGDQVSTGWIQGEELDGLRWAEQPEAGITVLDPLTVSKCDGTYQAKGVCAIGALALASLTEEGLRFKGAFTGWDTQVEVNLQVAIASVVLARRILLKKDKIQGVEQTDADIDKCSACWLHEPYPYAAAGVTQEKVKQLLRGPVSDILTAEPLLVTCAAKSICSFITRWNDHDGRTYSEVADLFTQASKDLLEAEHEIKE